MRYALVGVVVLVATVAFALVMTPGVARPPCESGAWQESWMDGHDGDEVCMPVAHPRNDPLPSFSYSLDV